MSDYVIGDVHACLDPLKRLLADIQFDPHCDRLWFTGDLIGRGPQPLETLRFIRDLGPAANAVLGNHDLHCLAVATGAGRLRANDQLEGLLESEDCNVLLDWLRHRPLMIDLPDLPYALVHAGIPPSWTIDEAFERAAEAEAALQGPGYERFLHHLYGNHPDRWDEALSGWDRLRFIINAFTRMRYIGPDDRLDFDHNGPPQSAPALLRPWYQAAATQLDPAHATLITGHWSQLGRRQQPGHIALDTGCLWGGELTAVCLDSNEPAVFTAVDCPMALPPG